MDKTEMKQRLDAIFEGLWRNGNVITGSWSASSYDYHPNFIRRGPLLLRGETSLSGMWVLIPGNCKVTPVQGSPRIKGDTFPIIEGEAVSVSLQDEGPWLDYLASEIPLMETILQEIYRERKAAEQKVKEEKDEKRRAELNAAKAVFTN